MEYIGDALLNVVITLELSQRFPGASRGDLTCKRAHLLSQDTCAHIAHTLGLSGSGCIKSMIGTIFMDSAKSHEVVHAWIVWHWHSHLCNGQIDEVDAKTKLQERTQRAGLGLPTYVVVDANENDRHRVNVFVASYMCTGEGTTKKHAEKDAATKMMCMLTEGRDAMMSTARRVPGGIVFPGVVPGLVPGAHNIQHMCRLHSHHSKTQCIYMSASHKSQILSR